MTTHGIAVKAIPAARRATWTRYDKTDTRKTHRATRKGHIRPERILIRRAFKGHPGWAVHSKNVRGYGPPPVPDDVPLIPGRYCLDLPLASTIEFQAAFKLSPRLNDWCNYFFVGIPLDGNPSAFDDAFRYISLSDLRARIDGWSCRQIIDFCKARWDTVAQAINAKERRQRILDSTRAVIRRIQVTWRDIHELDALLQAHRRSLDSHLRFETLFTSIRLWRYQELCIHRSELFILWNCSVAESLEYYTTGQLGFQTCWSGTTSTKELIQSAWNGELTNGGEALGSEQDDASNGEESEESER